MYVSLGYTRQPKWGHLKELHASIKLMEKALTYGEVEEVNLDNELMVSMISDMNLSFDLRVGA